MDVTAVVTLAVLIAQFKDYFDAALHIFNSYFVHMFCIFLHILCIFMHIRCIFHAYLVHICSRFSAYLYIYCIVCICIFDAIISQCRFECFIQRQCYIVDEQVVAHELMYHQLHPSPSTSAMHSYMNSAFVNISSYS